MGEYLLYYDGTLFGYIYDSKLLIKIVDSNKNIIFKNKYLIKMLSQCLIEIIKN